jgi:hypothetical protein
VARLDSLDPFSLDPFNRKRCAALTFRRGPRLNATGPARRVQEARARPSLVDHGGPNRGQRKPLEVSAGKPSRGRRTACGMVPSPRDSLAASSSWHRSVAGRLGCGTMFGPCDGQSLGPRDPRPAPQGGRVYLLAESADLTVEVDASPVGENVVRRRPRSARTHLRTPATAALLVGGPTDERTESATTSAISMTIRSKMVASQRLIGF